MIQFLTASQIEIFLAFNVAVCVVSVAADMLGRARRMARIGGAI